MNDVEINAPIGFLTVLELADIGYCGGLLVLNDRGRPLEFHCNSPIRPSRAQEILYGTTLRSFLLTDAISMSLIEKCSRAPRALLTDLPELCELSPSLNMPIAWVPPESAADHDGQPLAPWTWIEISGQRIGLSASTLSRGPELESTLANFARHLPLSEPFQRIRLAIEEAQSSARWREAA